VIRALWQALEAVDGGDPEAMARVMTPDAHWFPPGGTEEAVRNGPDMSRAMGPWSNEALEVDIRRVIDLGDRPFVAQVSVGNRKQPSLRYELVLLVETRGDRIAAVHHFGDPLGPVRVGPNEQEPLDLGPLVDPTLEGGPPVVAHGDTTLRLVEALEDRNDATVRALLAADVVLHDVTARRTRRGRDAYLTGFHETLGPKGHLEVIRHHASERFVIIEGTLHGREPAPQAATATPQEHGFADLHRLADGVIVETWHYVNRRGRARLPRARP
jgi:ketosteroid isomerase-like protein